MLRNRLFSFWFVMLGMVTFVAPVLAAEEEAKEEEAKESADTAPPPVNWKPAGVVLPPATTGAVESKRLLPDPMFRHGEFEFSAHGQVAAMMGMVGEDARTSNGDVLSQDGFRIRRARLGVGGQIMKNWEFELELDLIDEDNGGNSLNDANITWRPYEWGWVRVGAGKPGFSRALIQSSGAMQFLERPMWVNQERATDTHMLDLDHQVGMSMGGKLSLFFYEAGVYNGSPGFSKGDLNDGMLYLVRLGAGQGDMGKSEADLARGDFRWRVAINGYLNHEAAAEYRGAGADLSLKWNGLSFHAEALWAKGIPNERPEDVASELDEVERWGMYAQAGYMLPFDFLDLEVAVRFAMMDDQVHIDDEGDQWEMTAGVNAYFWEDQVKLMLNYMMREEMHGADLSNDMLAAMLQVKF
ncbi:MAG: hypothetical protein JRF33_00620 [Deltaproteobacteria bacterium]|nr:hypothetical protein [Deltaproteobacteria bacterium]